MGSSEKLHEDLVGTTQTGAWARRARAIVPLILLFVGLLAALYWRILPALVQQWWDDPNYSHGFVVPFFSAYLIWNRRERLQSLAISPADTSGVMVLLVGLGMLILGDIGAELFLSRSSLIVIMAGLILLHTGPAGLREVAFPLTFLFFMIPVPAILFYAVTFPLQSLAAQNAAWILDLVGVPVLLDGNVLHLSQISLGVTEACSGVRSLISLLALGMAWAYLTLKKRWAMALLVASALPITIAANSARVVSTGLIGQWFGMTYAQGFFHTFSGWLIFLFAFGALLAVHSIIRVIDNMWFRRTR